MNAKELLYAKIEERDRFEFSLCDATDVKASIILLLITFLATLAASLLADKDLNIIVRSWQVLVVALLAVSGVFSVLCLKPRDYSTEKTPPSYAEWLSKLTEHMSGHPNAESIIADEFKKGIADKALERIASNYAINRRKLDNLNVAFWFVVASLAVELALLLLLAAMPLF